MGGCLDCTKNKNIPIEEHVREKVFRLRICRLSVSDLKSKLNSILLKFDNKKTGLIEEAFSQIFYNNISSSNSQHILHGKIWEAFFELMKKEFNVKEFLFLAYPLLKKNRGMEHEEFIQILRDLYGETYSHNKIRILLMQLFEFYTFTITRIFQDHDENLSNKSELNLLIIHMFNFSNIDKAINLIIKRFQGINLDEYNINSSDLAECFRDNLIMSVEDIRDFVINIY